MRSLLVSMPACQPPKYPSPPGVEGARYTPTRNTCALLSKAMQRRGELRLINSPSTRDRIPRRLRRARARPPRLLLAQRRRGRLRPGREVRHGARSAGLPGGADAGDEQAEVVGDPGLHRLAGGRLAELLRPKKERLQRRLMTCQSLSRKRRGLSQDAMAGHDSEKRILLEKWKTSFPKPSALSQSAAQLKPWIRPCPAYLWPAPPPLRSDRATASPILSRRDAPPPRRPFWPPAL